MSLKLQFVSNIKSSSTQEGYLDSHQIEKKHTSLTHSPLPDKKLLSYLSFIVVKPDMHSWFSKLKTTTNFLLI